MTLFLIDNDHIIQSIGAINCIVRRPTDGKLFGLNTDYFGAISAIENGLRGFYYVLLDKFFLLFLYYGEDFSFKVFWDFSLFYRFT